MPVISFNHGSYMRMSAKYPMQIKMMGDTSADVASSGIKAKLIIFSICQSPRSKFPPSFLDPCAASMQILKRFCDFSVGHHLHHGSAGMAYQTTAQVAIACSLVRKRRRAACLRPIIPVSRDASPITWSMSLTCTLSWKESSLTLNVPEGQEMESDWLDGQRSR